MTALKAVLAATLFGLVLAGTTRAQPDTPRSPEWSDRLRSLSPNDPEAYFLLGEEVAAAVTNPEDLELATRLFVLAFELDRADGDPTWISPSACIALADLSRLQRERRWLLALASSLDPRYAQSDWHRADPVGESRESAFAAAEAVGLVRAGEGILARERLADPEVRALIERYEELLSPVGVGGWANRVQRDAELWPCPECKNARITKLLSGPRADYSVCPVCNGNPGPRLTREEFIAHLRFESVLLNGVQRNWSAQFAVDGGVPLRDPDVEELAPTLRVDPSLSIYRNGRWVEPSRTP
ncbi:MAG: hypothetical protein ACF8SC_06140 [Phycisphaerales bacterium JB037]